MIAQQPWCQGASIAHRKFAHLWELVQLIPTKHYNLIKPATKWPVERKDFNNSSEANAIIVISEGNPVAFLMRILIARRSARCQNRTADDSTLGVPRPSGHHLRKHSNNNTESRQPQWECSSMANRDHRIEPESARGSLQGP